MKQKFRLVTFTVLALLLMIFATSCGSKTVDLKDYVEVLFEKYDGYGYAQIMIDWDGLNTEFDYERANDFVWENVQKLGLTVDSKEELRQSLESSCSGFFLHPEITGETMGLSNGDKITISFDVGYQFQMHDFSLEEIEAALGMKFKNKELEFKVKGLEKAKKVKIDTESNISVDFGLYNGYATPVVNVSEDMFSEIIPDLWMAYKNTPPEEAYVNIRHYDSILDFFSIDFAEPYSNVSNGDKLKVVIKPSAELENAGVTLKDLEKDLMLDFDKTELKFKVEGLQEAKNVINVFEDIDKYVIYNGGNGYGRLRKIEFTEDYSKQYGELYFKPDGSSIKVIYNNTNICKITFIFENVESLKFGDKIPVTAYFSEKAALENMGYIIASEQGHVTVPDLGTYLSSKSQITPEILEKIISKIKETRNNDEVCEIFYATFNPGIECIYKSTSFVVPITKTSSWLWGDTYYVDSIFDIIIKPDGNVVLESFIGNSSYDSYEKALESLDHKSYTFEEIEGFKSPMYTNDAEELENIVGTYKGSYTAGQGEVGLTLKVYKEGNDYKALFDFYNLPDQTNSEEGSYLANVTYKASDNTYRVKGYEWVEEVESYSFIELIGTLNGNRFSGDKPTLFDVMLER